MKRKRKVGTEAFTEVPFRILVETVEELAELRRSYAAKPSKDRKAAAEWEYHEDAADEFWQCATGRTTNLPFPRAVYALAIDPSYAPAILTVGSMEYLYGRAEEAMALFMKLPAFSSRTEDLPVLIDKAGDFLCKHRGYENALRLYREACARHPKVALFHDGLSYALGKMQRLQEAIPPAERAVRLEPDKFQFLSNLGWTYLQVGRLDEGETVLKKAVELDVHDVGFARENLKELYRRRKRKTTAAAGDKRTKRKQG